MKTNNPADLTGSFELEQFLPYRLSLLTNTVSRGIALGYASTHDLSVTEWRILAVLGRFPGLTASEVVDRTAMDKVAISRAVNRLIDRGLLLRKTDLIDRRRRKLSIGGALGQEVLQDVIPKALKYERALLSTLDETEKAQLGRLLDRLQGKAAQLNDELI